MRNENDNDLPKVRFYPQALVFFAMMGMFPLLVMLAVATKGHARYGAAGFFLVVLTLLAFFAFAWRRGALSGE